MSHLFYWYVPAGIRTPASTHAADGEISIATDNNSDGNRRLTNDDVLRLNYGKSPYGIVNDKYAATLKEGSPRSADAPTQMADPQVLPPVGNEKQRNWHTEAFSKLPKDLPFSELGKTPVKFIGSQSHTNSTFSNSGQATNFYKATTRE